VISVSESGRVVSGVSVCCQIQSGRNTLVVSSSESGRGVRGVSGLLSPNRRSSRPIFSMSEMHCCTSGAIWGGSISSSMEVSVLGRVRLSWATLESLRALLCVDIVRWSSRYDGRTRFAFLVGICPLRTSWLPLAAPYPHNFLLDSRRFG
jgi:hypothetical protein